MKNERNSLTRRLLEPILLVSVVVLTLGILVRGAVEKTRMDAEWAGLRSSIVARIQASCLNAVWELDEKSLHSILHAEMLNRAIVAIRIDYEEHTRTMGLVRNAAGEVLEKTFDSAALRDHQEFDLVWMPGTSSSRNLATVTIGFDSSGPEGEYWSDLAWNLLLVAAIVGSLIASLLVVVYRRLLRPLEVIRGGLGLSASASSSGYPILPIRSRLGNNTFPELNRMADDLDQVFQQIGEAIALRRESEEKVNAVNHNLDFLVRERTSELALANENLNKALETVGKAQKEMVSTAQMAVLGRLVASIAHEINSPMGALISANSTVLRGLSELSSTGWQSLRALTTEDREWVLRILAHPGQGGTVTGQQERERRRSYEVLLSQSGLKAEVGMAQSLVETEFPWDEATLRELFSTANAGLVVDTVVQLRTLVHASKIIEAASQRVAKFVQALRTYVRKEDDAAVADVDLAESLETVLVLFQHQFRLGIEVVKDFQPVPLVRCRPDEIQQVWANLISNANHAMNYKGTLTLGLKSVPGGVSVSFSDTGHGVAPEHQEKIFEPFFSTKKAGEGTGLGLDISRKIVEAAGGTLSVESRPGLTVFTVLLSLPLA